MTKPDWSDPKNYEYLKGKTADNWTKGWAWEFIRRNAEYRATYATFNTGPGWQKKQKAVAAFPPKLDGESDAAWRVRAADMGYIAEYLTASQLRARQWMLRELYDPDLPYAQGKIIFDVVDYFPRIYANAALDDKKILEPEYLQAELKHNFRPNVVYIAFDLSRSLKWQLEQVRPVIKQHFGEVKEGSGKQGQYKKWLFYVRILDAVQAGEHNMTEAVAKIGLQVSKTNHGNMTGKAFQHKKAALKMAATGYRGLLDKIRNRAA